MKIITLSGVDGSGKSTQLYLLRAQLEKDGRRVAYFHAVQFSLLETLRAFFLGSRSIGSGKASSQSTRLGIWLRKTMLAIDLWRFKRFVKKLGRSGTEYLLSDRYFYDTLVNIAYLEKVELDTSFTQWANAHIPKPEHAYYLRVTPERVMERERAPEQGLQYLQDKTVLFNEAAREWSFIILDADQPIEGVFENLKQSL